MNQKSFKNYTKNLNKLVLSLLILFSAIFTSTTATAWPHAMILEITPKISAIGETVSFKGAAGTGREVVSYQWTSNVDGLLSTDAEFDTNQLSEGAHNISLDVDWVGRYRHKPDATFDPANLFYQWRIFVNSEKPKGSNLVLNPGFEDNLKGNWVWRNGFQSKIKIIKDFPDTGNQLLAIQGPSVAQQFISNSIVPGNTYRIKASVAVKNRTKGFYSIIARWYFINKQGRLEELKNTKNEIAKIQNNTDFIIKSSDIVAPTNEIADAKIAVLFIKSMRADGTAYFDNIEFIDVTTSDMPLPVAYITSPVPNQVNVGQYIDFMGDASWDKGVIVNYQWQSDIDGLLSENQHFAYNGLSVGTHHISLRVSDENGVWSARTHSTIEIVEADGQENLIRNGDFEYGLSEWAHRAHFVPLPGYSRYSKSSGIYGIIKGNERYDTPSGPKITPSTKSYLQLKIEDYPVGYHLIFQSASQLTENTIIGGDTYRIEGRLRTNSIQVAYGQYFIQVRWYDSAGEEIIDSRTDFNIQQGKRSDFIRDFVDIAAPSDAVSSRILLNAKRSKKSIGSADFDDIAIRHLY